MTAETLQPDLCVIGASEAGRAVAMGAVAMGCAVVMIDDGDPTGRRNRDLTLDLLREAARCRVGDPQVARALLRAGLDRAAPERSHARLAAMTIRVIPATARFRDPETVEAGRSVVRARRFVIATGRTQLAAGAGTAVERLSALADMATWPDRLVVHGGETEALSVVQSLARLGIDVALVGASILPGLDAELAAPLLARLRHDGVDLAITAPPSVAVHVGEGLDPALDALTLEKAAVAQRGTALVLTPSLRTTNPRIYAVGCPAGAPSTAAGLAQAGFVLRAAVLRLPVRDKPGVVPTLVLTDPEIAQVGLSEDAAQARRPIHVWRWPLAQTGPGLAAAATVGQQGNSPLPCGEGPGVRVGHRRSLELGANTTAEKPSPLAPLRNGEGKEAAALRDLDSTAVREGGNASADRGPCRSITGHLKVVTDKRGRILGAGIVGPQARELIGIWTLAVAQGLHLTDLASLPVPVPSWSEAVRGVAVAQTARRLDRPWIKRALGLMRRIP